MKDALLCDTLTLINLRGCDKRKVMEEDKRRVKQRLFQGHQQPQEAKYSRCLTCLVVRCLGYYYTFLGIKVFQKQRAAWD